MEHFDHLDNVKQKSVYMLHLDKARVILIGAVVIGIVIASFLFGMNYIKKDSSKDTSQMGNTLSMQFNDKDADMLDNKTSHPDGDTDVNKPGNEKLLKEKDRKDSKDDSKDVLNDLKDDDKSSKNTLTKEKTDDVIPMDDDAKNSKKKFANKSKSNDDRKIAHKKKDNKKIKNSKRKHKTRKNSRVVEVSHKKSSSIKQSSAPQYSIQIASYDKKSKATKEVQKLKKMDYDAYINRETVNGKRYFRVRIGPIASKKKALQLLNNIQDVNRYENSYMVKE